MEVNSEIKIDISLKDLKLTELEAFLQILIYAEMKDLDLAAQEFLPKITKAVSGVLNKFK